MKCVHFFIEYYGAAPVEIIYELYKLKIEDGIDEMIDMPWEMPVDIVESCIFPMDKIGLQNISKDAPLYSLRGLFIHIPILMDEELFPLLRQQMDKEFYITSVQQIEEICRTGYEESSPAYKKLKTFLMKKMDMPYDHAVSWCLQAWANSYEGESIGDILDKMSEANVIFENEKQTNEILGLLVDAHNNTRMIENRGHNPNELASKGMTVDLEGNADTVGTAMYTRGPGGNVIRIGKKIYPNDPCPCGSGKKYKKCCGRN